MSAASLWVHGGKHAAFIQRRAEQLVAELAFQAESDLNTNALLAESLRHRLMNKSPHDDP